MDVRAWLRDLGLAQYESAFRENNIDAEVLGDLTAEDLVAIGISSVGHRRKLLAAIQSLRQRSGAETAPGPHSPAAVSEVKPRAPDAERRQLTVMFIDLVNSTALAASLDPEEMGDVLRAYQRSIAGAIAGFEGHVAKYMGDGVLAYFGYPRAHEDEAERAVRAGLAAAEAVRNLAIGQGRTLAVRVGIATGQVVVGELIGEGTAREETVVGETPNLAARLQTVAEPGAVVIEARTRHLVRGLFELAELGTLALKGFPVRVRAWRVVAERPAESRFEALHRAGMTPLVGRAHDLGLLLERWELAKEGEGQVVLLAGEPGIGKSRLVRALRERLEGEPHIALSHYCSPHHQTSPLHPIIGHLERAAGFVAHDPPQLKLNKLEALLADSAESDLAAGPLLAALLSIEIEPGYPPLEMSPHRRKERTLELLVALLLRLARYQPVLAVYEDVQWADPTSLELLDLVVDRVQASPVLVLITLRPEFVPRWTRYRHVTSLSLSRLSRRHGAAMVDQLTGGKVLPAPVLDQIVAKTDGVPLFVEELTRAVLEARLLSDEGDHYALARPLPPMAIPTTLQGSLLARLDRLAPAREVAQVAAVIGRDFSHELLAAAAALSESDLQAALEALIESGLVFRRGTPPQASYSFKHALVQEAAYSTLVRSKRQRLHASVAAAIEEHFPEATQAQPELLAHHYTEAGTAETAIDYWLRAGQADIARSATTEAVAHLTRGLELLGELPDDPTRWQQELELQVALGVALMAAKGWAAPEVGRANARARELCQRLGDTPRLFPVLYGEWVFHVVRAELGEGRQAGKELLHLAQRQGNRSAETVGSRILGTSSFLCGEMALARAQLERALALYDPVADRALAYLFAQDPRVAGLSVLSLALFALGSPEQAQARSADALAEARELAHRNTLGYALLYSCILSQLRRDLNEAHQRADMLISLATEQGSPHFLAAGAILRGWTFTAEEPQLGVEQIRDGLAAWQSTGANFLVPFFLSLLAELQTGVARPRQGLDLLTDALRRAGATGEGWFTPELHRLAAELMMQSPETRAAADAHLHQAITIARQQGAKLWELRATTSLAELLMTQGRHDEAQTLLAPICADFPINLG